MTQTEFKFHTPNGKFYTIIEVENEYRLKNNRDIKVMINSNRNKSYISDENALAIKDSLLGTSNNSLYHLVFFNTAENKDLRMKKALRGVKLVG